VHANSLKMDGGVCGMAEGRSTGTDFQRDAAMTGTSADAGTRQGGGSNVTRNTACVGKKAPTLAVVVSPGAPVNDPMSAA
jgi:hypothetical protein